MTTANDMPTGTTTDTDPKISVRLLGTGGPWVDGERFGTVNFTSSEPRTPFESSDLELIKMFAAWIAQQLSIEKATNQLIEIG